MRKIIYNEEKAIIDEGIYFGCGVFETIYWGDKPLFLDEHLDRLSESVEKLNMEELEIDKILEFFDTLNIKNKAVKITVTPCNIIISQRDIPYDDSCYNKGVTLCTSNVCRNSTSIMAYIKSTCYYENIIEKEKVVEKGYNDALFFNEKGSLTETSCANIFIVRNDMIFTPRISDGLLDGIIRRWIIKNFNVIEKTLTYKELEECDEVFISNSLMGVMSVSKIDEISYSDRKVCNIIRNSYEKLRQN